MSRWLYWISLLYVFIGTACAVKTTQPDPRAALSSLTSSSTTVPAASITRSPTHTPVPFEEVAAEVQTPRPSATPAICTPLPEGMHLRIVPESKTAFILELSGFEAGESLVFLLAGEAEGYGTQLETRPVDRVGSSGKYRSEKFDLGHYSPVVEWRGKVVHSQGVACFDLTLPLSTQSIDYGETP